MTAQAPTSRTDTSSNSGPANTAQVSKLHKLAAKAGMSVSAYAKANIHTDGVVGQLARMYYTMNSGGVHGDGKADMSGGGDKRTLSEKLYQIG